MGNGRKRKALLAALPLSALAAGILISLWGCSNSDAQTAADLRIETFTINPSSFVIVTDNTPNTAPTITVDGDTTKYEIQSDGSLSFTTVGGNPRVFDLDPEDVVIERPLAGLLTFIRGQ